MKAVCIGGSAGSIPVLRNLIFTIARPFSGPIIICIHRMKNVQEEGICDVLSTNKKCEIIEPVDKTPLQPDCIYLAPANYHLLIEDDLTFALSTEPLIHYLRPSIDVTLMSAAHVFKNKLAAILLTGANKDGAEGLQFVKVNGGTTIVQEPSDCAVATMPLAALQTGCVDLALPQAEIGERINSFFRIK